MCVDKYVCADLSMELITAGGCDNTFYEKVERILCWFALWCTVIYMRCLMFGIVFWCSTSCSQLVCWHPSNMPSVSYLVSFLFLSKTDMSFFFFTFSFFVSVCLTFLSLSFAFSLIVSLSRPLSVFYFFFFFFILISLQSCHIIFLVIPMWPVYAPSPCILHFSVNILSVFLSIPATSLPPPPPPLFFCLPILSHSLFPPHLPSFSPFSFCSSFIDRIISKMPGIFLTVWQFWAALLTSWWQSLG